MLPLFYDNKFVVELVLGQLGTTDRVLFSEKASDAWPDRNREKSENGAKKRNWRLS
jgi:hypothetical protein